jgi:hypothetical protein
MPDYLTNVAGCLSSKHRAIRYDQRGTRRRVVVKGAWSKLQTPLFLSYLQENEVRPAGFEPATRGLKVCGGYLPPRIALYREAPYLQAFRKSESADTCHRISLRIGPVVVKIVVKRDR